MSDEPSAATAIATEQLSKHYENGTRALESLDLSVPAGRCLGLLGRNGSGKTTLVRLLAGLTLPTAGRALVGGIDPARDPVAVRRLVGVATQSEALDPHMTVAEHVRLVTRLWRMEPAAEHAEELMERLGLDAVRSSLVRRLSGGTRRRLDLLLALVHRPTVLLLDEPTVGLDPQARHAVWSFLEELRSRGVTLLLTTQYLEEADRLCERIAVLAEGRIVAEGSPTRLKRRLGSSVVTFHTSTPAQLADRLRDLGATESSGQVRVRVEAPEDLPRVLRAALAAGGVKDVEVSAPSLEDVYLELTGHAPGGGGEPSRHGDVSSSLTSIGARG